MEENKIIYLLILISSLIGCSSGGQKKYIFKNDFESVQGWENISGIGKGDAHSGSHFIYADNSNPYSKTFKISLKDISDKQFSRFRFLLWCKTSALPLKADVVISLSSGKTDNVVYEGIDLAKTLESENKWYPVQGEISIKPKDTNVIADTLLFYIWNQGSSIIYGDDVQLQFVE